MGYFSNFLQQKLRIFWNYLDLTIVCTSMVEVIFDILLVVQAGDSETRIAPTNLIRVVRIVRVLRVMRVIKVWWFTPGFGKGTGTSYTVKLCKKTNTYIYIDICNINIGVSAENNREGIATCDKQVVSIALMVSPQGYGAIPLNGCRYSLGESLASRV